VRAEFTGDHRVALYLRYSSDKQREASIEDQERVCRAYLERNGGHYREGLVFRDRGQNGAGADRKGFAALMAALLAKPPMIDAIICEDVSRVSRDLADAATLFRQLQYLRVPLIGVSDVINTADPSAKVSYTVRSLVADLYLDDLKAKTKRGLEGRFRKGHNTGGLAFGYQSTPVKNADGEVIGHEIGIHEAQAEVVRRIFSLYLEGFSLAGIAKLLNAEAIPPARAKMKYRHKGWCDGTVRAMLRNERYAGVWKFGQREWVKVPGTNKRRYRKRPANDVLTEVRPDLAIIDAQTWAEVEARLKAVRAKYAETRDGQPKGTRAAWHEQ
jgi:DNA invertase Pin-like site-specific DNA recombinase